jgi:2'-5' RNA ligase
VFVALELPDEALDVLVDWQRASLAGVPELRGVRRDALHATLCFLGGRPAEEIEAIGQACDVVAGRQVPGLALGAALWLPARRRPTVLAIALEDPDGALQQAQAALAAALEAIGAYERQERDFLPHVTVARVRGHQPARDVRDELAVSLERTTAAFSGVVVSLFRSHLGGGPARYERLRSVPLGAA